MIEMTIFKQTINLLFFGLVSMTIINVALVIALAIILSKQQ